MVNTHVHMGLLTECERNTRTTLRKVRRVVRVVFSNFYVGEMHICYNVVYMQFLSRRSKERHPQHPPHIAVYGYLRVLRVVVLQYSALLQTF